MLSPEEQAEWRDPDDYEHVCQVAAAIAPLTRHVRAIEARVGSSPAWQDVVDDFALFAGYGLCLDDNTKGTMSIAQDNSKTLT